MSSLEVQQTFLESLDVVLAYIKVFFKEFFAGFDMVDIYWLLIALAFLYSWFLNRYLVLWALKHWEFLRIQWFWNALNSISIFIGRIIQLKFIDVPLSYLKQVVAAFDQDRRFDSDNEGFVLLYVWFAYPLLWIVTTNADFVNIFSMPLMMTLYIIDKGLFVDAEASEIAGQNVPREGIPTLFAKYYNIHALLWADFTYLDDKTDLEITLIRMIFLYWFSFVQIGLSILLEPFIWVWAIISGTALSFIVLYEVIFLDISFHDPDIDYLAEEGSDGTAKDSPLPTEKSETIQLQPEIPKQQDAPSEPEESADPEEIAEPEEAADPEILSADEEF